MELVFKNENQEKLYNSIINDIKRKQVRLTDMRKMIIKLLIINDHLTVQGLIEKLTKYLSNVNITTVYNTLDFLLENHITFANTFDGKEIWYEIVSDNSIHLKCDECGKIIHIGSNKIDTDKLDNIMNLPKEKKDFKVDHFKIEVHGTCKDCKN